MALKSFKYWKREEVHDTFGLQQVFSMPLMEEWLQVNIQTIPQDVKKQLEALKLELLQFATDWNEATLKFFFLSPLMRLVDFHVGVYNPFLEHSLSAEIGSDKASGKVDFMVAQGRQIPKAPFFCLHEYKPEEGTSNDPYGQLLIAMIAAQQENLKIKLDIPIYGVYNLGNIFYFVLLNGKKYIRSTPYAATKADIFEIYLILEKVKDYIEDFKSNN